MQTTLNTETIPVQLTLEEWVRARDFVVSNLSRDRAFLMSNDVTGSMIIIEPVGRNFAGKLIEKGDF